MSETNCREKTHFMSTELFLAFFEIITTAK